MSVLTEKGFIRGTYEGYLADLERMARELYGSDVDLSDSSPIGQTIRLLAYEKVERDDLAEDVYNSTSVDTATGAALDNAVKIKGLIRFGELPAYGEVLFHVEPGTMINAGMLIGIPNTNITYYVTETTGDYDGNGFINVVVEATEPGAAGNTPAKTITDIVTPMVGVNGVSNPEPFVNGKDKETDAELRNRFYATTGSGASLDGLRSKILNEVPGVRSVIIAENSTNVEDPDGRPPNSFETYVLGGDREEIAKALLSKPAGIRPYGQESVVVADDSGMQRLIEFTYAQPVTIYVNVDVKINPSFPIDGVDMIKLEVIKYIGGIFNGNYFTGLGMGKNVIYGKIASNIFALPGVDDVTVTLSTDGENFNAQNIPISFDSVAGIEEERVVVNVV